MTGLRRKEKEIKDKGEIEEVLRDAQIGRLGTSVDGQPYVVPLSFAYHDGKIIFHGAREGKKMEDIARNPRVCFEVDNGEAIPSDDPCGFSFRYRSVIANGTAKIIEDPKTSLEALRILVDKYSPGKGEKLTLERIERSKNMVVVEIAVDEMVGKKSPV